MLSFQNAYFNYHESVFPEIEPPTTWPPIFFGKGCWQRYKSFTMIILMPGEGTFLELFTRSFVISVCQLWQAFAVTNVVQFSRPREFWGPWGFWIPRIISATITKHDSFWKYRPYGTRHRDSHIRGGELVAFNHICFTNPCAREKWINILGFSSGFGKCCEWLIWVIKKVQQIRLDHWIDNVNRCFF